MASEAAPSLNHYCLLKVIGKQGDIFIGDAAPEKPSLSPFAPGQESERGRGGCMCVTCQEKTGQQEGLVGKEGLREG